MDGEKGRRSKEARGDAVSGERDSSGAEAWYGAKFIWTRLVVDSSPRRRRVYGAEANMACGICKDLRQPRVTVADVLLSRQVKVGSFGCPRLEKQETNTDDNIPRNLGIKRLDRNSACRAPSAPLGQVAGVSKLSAYPGTHSVRCSESSARGLPTPQSTRRPLLG